MCTSDTYSDTPLWTQLTKRAETDLVIGLFLEINIDFMQVCQQQTFLFMFTLDMAINYCPDRYKFFLTRTYS